MNRNFTVNEIGQKYFVHFYSLVWTSVTKFNENSLKLTKFYDKMEC